MQRFQFKKQLKPVLNWFQLFLTTVVELIYPPLCLLCQSRLQQEENCICQKCWDLIPKLFHPLVDINLPGKQKPAFSRAYAVWNFNPQIQQVIHLFKYSRFTQLAQPLAVYMVEVIRLDTDYEMADGLVPVPLHDTRERERGYNQSLLLCAEISKLTGIPVLSGNLKRTRPTETQTNLSALKRLYNVKDAFSVCKPDLLKGKNIILVDDVLTTGSTLNACARELKNAGVNKIYVLTTVRA